MVTYTRNVYCDFLGSGSGGGVGRTVPRGGQPGWEEIWGNQPKSRENQEQMWRKRENWSKLAPADEKGWIRPWGWGVSGQFVFHINVVFVVVFNVMVVIRCYCRWVSFKVVLFMTFRVLISIDNVYSFKFTEFWRAIRQVKTLTLYFKAHWSFLTLMEYYSLSVIGLGGENIVSINNIKLA